MPRGRKKDSSNQRSEEYFSEIGKKGGKSKGSGRGKKQQDKKDQDMADFWSIDE